MISLNEAFGASEQSSVQVLTVYVPNKDRDGKELSDQHEWIRKVADLLARIGGGVTIMPPVEGGWLREDGVIIWEQPVLVYTYIKADAFEEHLPQLRRLLHRMGRETNQGEIAVEFDRVFYRIQRYDEE